MHNFRLSQNIHKLIDKVIKIENPGGYLIRPGAMLFINSDNCWDRCLRLDCASVKSLKRVIATYGIVVDNLGHFKKYLKEM